MFEKEAEEWVKENMDCCKTDNSVNQSIPYFSEEERCCAKSAFKDGAEFGYNKCKEEINKNGLALQSDMDKTIEQNFALKAQIEKMTDTETMLKILKDRGVIRSWYYNGTYHVGNELPKESDNA